MLDKHAPLEEVVRKPLALKPADQPTSNPERASHAITPVAAAPRPVRKAARLQFAAEGEVLAWQSRIFAALPNAALIVSGDAGVLAGNPAAVALFGQPAQTPGQKVTDLLPFLDGRPLNPRGEIWQGQITDASGCPRDLEVSRVALDWPPGASLYVINEITRHAELNRWREQLLYNAAHELRAPLAVLDNALELLLEEGNELSAAESTMLLRSARRTALRLRHITDGLLSAGSIRSGRFMVNPCPTELVVMVEEAIETLGVGLARRGQRVELLVGRHQVMADELHVRQVLMNLLSNAAKYSPDDAVIRVLAEPQDTCVCVTVEDRGRGIPAEQLAGIFERFYRAQPSAGSPGIGLGLAIARGIVAAHGGAIGIESEVGVGTRVWFTLPKAEERR